MMEIVIAPIASGVVSAVIAAFGVYVAITNRLTQLETQQKADREALMREMHLMRDDLEKHNSVIERTFKMESDLNTAFKHIDENRERISRIENVKIGGGE